MQKVKKIKDVEFAHGLKLDIYVPDACVSTFIYFHGGGLESGDKSDAAVFADVLAEKGIAVVSANYRMYPDAAYPDFIEDASAAVAWVYYNADLYGLSKKIFAGGSSAGGYLSMMLCFAPEFLKQKDVKTDDIAGYVFDAGQPTVHFNVLRERGLDCRRIIVDEAAPLYYVGTAANYPPMLIIVSDDDIACRYQQTEVLIASLENFGCKNYELQVSHGKHCDYVLKTDGEGKGVFGSMIAPFILSKS